MNGSKWFRCNVVAIAAALVCMTGVPALAAEEPADKDEKVARLDDVIVQDKGGAPGVTVTPEKTVIDLDDFSTIGTPDSVLDVLKTQAAIDFRGENDLDPGVDSVYLRGFDSQKFVTALDGMTLQKTGGRKSSNIVDYSLLPAFLVQKIEILPGPHWAMYDAKAIGGALNFISQAPKRYDSLKPELSLSTSYGSYETFTENTEVRGGVSAFNYDLAYRKYRTDGYLRNSESDMDTVYGRMGLVLPLEGFVTLSASYSDVDRQALVNNPSSDGSDYDSDYPESSGSLFNPNQYPTWDSTSKNYRLNYEQALPIGRLSIGGFYGKDNRDRAYYVNAGDTSKTHMDTDWWQQGGKIQDAISWTPEHLTTVGFDYSRLYDEGLADEKTKRIDKQGTYLQHQWDILPSLSTKLGVRYEDLNIWISSSATNSYTERHFAEAIPKSFTTWKMDRLASWLRDTSLSAGVSKIWHAPDAHGTYNPQGRPLGLTLEPEHGRGYDLILDRRLWRDIAFKVDFSLYKIDDYIAGSVNVDEVEREGVDVELGGHLMDKLSFYLTYAWNDYHTQDGDATAAQSVDQRAKNRAGAGLRYDLFERTQLQLDYSYQDDELTEVWEEAEIDGELVDVFTGEYEKLDAYHVFDFGVRQTLFKRAGWFSDAELRVYVKNLFDEEYQNTSGYPAIDRTFGAAFSIKM